MAGKRDSRRHSTTSFSQNVVAVETSYEMLDVLYHFAIGRGLNLEVFGVSYFLTRKNFKSNLVLVVVLVLEYNGLFYFKTPSLYLRLRAFSIDRILWNKKKWH